MILVTGGTGLLGSHLLCELCLDNEPIRAIYRDPKKIELVKSLFKYYSPEKWLENFSKIQWVHSDILDIKNLEENFEGIKKVYHCAGLVNFTKKQFYNLIKTNREGTANIVNLCLHFNIEKLCYVSSTAAIGGQPNERINEDSKWKQSPETNGYSISKYSAEKEVWRGVEEGLNCVIVNPSVIFGAGSWDESSLTIFRTVSNGLKFYTSGQNGFVDARDVAKIMVLLTKSEIKNERFLCVGHNVPFRRIISEIAIKMEKDQPTINTPKWLAGLMWRLTWLLSKFTRNEPTITRATAKSAFSIMEYDNSKIKNALSYSFVDLNDTIENAIKGRIY